MRGTGRPSEVAPEVVAELACVGVAQLGSLLGGPRDDGAEASVGVRRIDARSAPPLGRPVRVDGVQ